MNLHKCKSFIIRSNIFFVVPLILAVQYNLQRHATIIVCVILFSTVYHLYDEKKFVLHDRFFAFALIISNLVLLYLSGFQSPYTELAFVAVAFAFYCYFNEKKNRPMYHGAWHVFSAVITVLCVLAYGG